ncbi:hypothetical protein TOPH_08416 [Tolypocladium ophioglossoides CBS 100239]|uniref:Uncharacterized protein n=1 Tax=Tolypocladium ophioglossoides (strain CBS 100239) TaxID=1163406 RepID=A0A0L0MZJ9_TOLOC|nr:hypothetical protein TOPH_08416 [Tolypocladium ophioglossoides CBS 100239]
MAGNCGCSGSASSCNCGSGLLDAEEQKKEKKKEKEKEKNHTWNYTDRYLLAFDVVRLPHLMRRWGRWTPRCDDPWMSGEEHDGWDGVGTALGHDTGVC